MKPVFIATASDFFDIVETDDEISYTNAVHENLGERVDSVIVQSIDALYEHYSGMNIDTVVG